MMILAQEASHTVVLFYAWLPRQVCNLNLTGPELNDVDTESAWIKAELQRQEMESVVMAAQWVRPARRAQNLPSSHAALGGGVFEFDECQQL